MEAISGSPSRLNPTAGDYKQLGAADAGDNSSAELFKQILEEEEGHVDWLEARLHLIDEIGYERYLSMQMKEE
jgi:bacterioferritin (cytochrome b1)